MADQKPTFKSCKFSNANGCYQFGLMKKKNKKQCHFILLSYNSVKGERRAVVAMMGMKPTAGFPFMFPEQGTLRRTCAWQAMKWKLTARESHAGRSGKLFRTRMPSKESMDKQPSHIRSEKDKDGEEEEARPKEVNCVLWPTAPTKAPSISKVHKNSDHFQRGLWIPWWVISRSPSHRQQIAAAV